MLVKSLGVVALTDAVCNLILRQGRARAGLGAGAMPSNDDPSFPNQLMATWVELTIRLGVLGLILYLSFTLVLPFISIAIWSVVLTVALYPMYAWMVGHLGGRRRLAAALLTLFNLLIVIGPATWLALGLIDSLRTVSENLDLTHLRLPPPPDAVKSWPIVGNSIYQYWDLASTNFQAAFAKVAPQLKPLGNSLLQIAAGAGTGAIKFIVAVVVAGFLFPPAPLLVKAITGFHANSLRHGASNSSSSPGLPSAPYRAASSAYRRCKRFSRGWVCWPPEFLLPA
jgi:predicted PurR-regulated permease PerM